MGMYTNTTDAQADGLIHYWDFNETSGTTCADQINGLDAVMASTGATDPELAIVDGDLDKARDMAAAHSWAAADHFTIKADPGATALNPSTTHTAYTLRARVYFRSVYDSQEGAYVFDVDDGAGGRITLFIWQDALEAYGSNAYYMHTSTLAVNAWTEAVITYDGADFRFYINGSEVYSVTSNNDLKLYAANDWYFGCMDGGNGDELQNLDGLLDEVAVWDRALSALEVSTLYNSGTAQAVIEPTPPPVLTPLTSPPESATYKAVLTGAPDSTTDLTLNISSFSARLRNQAESFLQVVVPNARNVAAEIEARPNGEIVVYQTTGGTDIELARSNFGDMRVDDGPKSGYTVTLSGHKYTTFATADGHEIQKYNYYSKSNGKSRIRCPIISGVEPADTINANGVQFIAGAVFINGASNLAYMEIGEA